VLPSDLLPANHDCDHSLQPPEELANCVCHAAAAASHGGGAKNAGGAEIVTEEGGTIGAPVKVLLDLEALMRRVAAQQRMRAGGGHTSTAAAAVAATSYRGAALQACAVSAKCFGPEAAALASDDAALAAVGAAAEARLWRAFAASGLRSPLALSVAAVRGCLQLLLSVTSAAEAGELAAALRAAGFVTAPGAGADAPLTVVPGPRLLRTLLEGGLGASTSHVHVSAGGGLWGATLQRQQAGGPAAALQLDTDAAAAAAVEGLPPLRIECIEPAAVALLAPFGGGVSVAVAAGRPGSSAAALQPPRPAGGEDADDPTSSTVSVKLHCSGPLDARRHRVVVTGGAAGAVKPLRVTLAGAVATLVLPRPAEQTVLQLQVVEDLPARLGTRVSAAAPLMALPAAAAAELAAAAQAGGAGVADAVRDMAWLLLLLRRQQVPTAVPLGAAGAGQLTDACGCALEALLSAGLFEAAATLLDAAAAAGVISTGMEATDAAGLRAAMAAQGGSSVTTGGTVAVSPDPPGRVSGADFLLTSGSNAAKVSANGQSSSPSCATPPEEEGLRSYFTAAAPSRSRSSSGLAAAMAAIADAPAAAAAAIAALRSEGTGGAAAGAGGGASLRQAQRRLAVDTIVFGVFVLLFPCSLAFAAAHRASQPLRLPRLPLRLPLDAAPAAGRCAGRGAGRRPPPRHPDTKSPAATSRAALSVATPQMCRTPGSSPPP
jgi:hypothetical protein